MSSSIDNTPDRFAADVHPSEALLVEFVHGKLDDAELDRIETHLHNCPSCCETLTELSRRQDRFVDELVSAARSSGHATDHTPGVGGDTPRQADTPSSGDAGPQEPPRTIGRFRVREQIGHGGFGVVLLADDPQLRREVAVKIPRLGAFLTSELRARFMREAQAAAALDHPNIVPIHEAGEADGVCYIASGYCRGPNLSAWLKEQTQPLGFDTAARLVVQLADAVAHAHSRGVLHRDLKPSNVLLDAEGGRSETAARGTRSSAELPPPASDLQARITDFGLAKLDGDGPNTTRSNVVMGTAGYMSPEQARGKAREITEATDIYSLGAILYELLTGRAPLAGESDVETLQRVQTEEPISPTRLRPKLPRDLATICMKCLEKEPRRRYGSSAALVDDLRRFLDGKSIQARPTSRVERLVRWCRRKPALAALSASVAMLLTALVCGSLVSSLWLREQQQATFAQLQETITAKGKAEAAEDRAVQEEQAAKRELFESLLAEARATRMSGRSGQKFDAMQALVEAAKLARSLKLGEDDRLRLRNEVIACLPLIDVRVSTVWPGHRLGSAGFHFTFDANMQRYATIDSDGRLVVRRIEDNVELCSLDIDAPRSRAPNWWLLLRFSPDGNYIAARGARHAGHRIPTRVWDLRTGELATEPFPLSHLHHELDFDFDFSPDSRRVAVGRPDGSVGLVEIRTGETRALLAAKTAPRILRFDPTGGRLAVCLSDEIRIVDTETGTNELRLPERASVVAWSSDGELLAAGSGESVMVWNSRSGAQLANFDGHQGSFVFMDFLPDSYTLASTSWVDTRLWNAVTGQRLLLVDDGNGWTFSRDRRWLGLGSTESEVGRFELALPTGYRTLGEMPEGQLEISPDGRLLLATDRDRLVFWDLASGRLLGTIAVPELEWLHAWFDDAGENVLTASTAGLHQWLIRRDDRHDRQASSEQSSTGLKLSVGPPRHLPFSQPINIEGVRPAGNDRALVSTGYEIRVLDLSRNESDPIRRIRYGGWWMAASGDGRWLARSQWLGFGTHVWDLNTGRRVHTFDGINARMEFGPDSHTLVIGNPGSIDVLDTGSWKPRHSIPSVDMGVGRPVVFSRDGRMLAVSTRHEAITLLNGRTFAELASFVTPGMERLTAMQLSPDGRRLVTCTANGIVHAWDLPCIRARLEEMGLDWEEPSPDSSVAQSQMESLADAEIQLEVDMGELQDIERLSKLIADAADNAELYVQRGHAYNRFQQTDEALRDFTKAVELDPARADAHFQHGRLLARKGSHTEAIESFTRTVELAPDHAGAFHQRGRSRLALNKGDQALADYTRASELEPEKWRLHEHRGAVLSQIKRWDEALAALTKAIELADDDWDRSRCYDRRAAVHDRQGDDAEALADRERAFELDRENYQRSNSLAWGLATVPDPGLQDPDRAVALARQSLELYRQNGMAWNTLGAAYYRQGSFDKALEAFDESMQLRGGDAFDWFFVAMIHWRKGNPEDARKWFDQAMTWMDAHNPEDADLNRFRAEADTLLSQ